MSSYLIKGSKKSEMIGGTPFDDAIFGAAGNDTIWGYKGDDEIGDIMSVDINRSFDDIYFGGQGNDVLHTFSGADRLLGGKGDDMIFAHTEDSFYANGARGFDVFVIEGSADDFHQEFTPDGKVVITGQGGEQHIEIHDFEDIIFTHDETDWL